VPQRQARPSGPLGSPIRYPHPGSITTIYANSAAVAVEQLMLMVRQLLPAPTAVPVAPLAVDRGELAHGAPNLGRGVQFVAQEARIERSAQNGEQES